MIRNESILNFRRQISDATFEYRFEWKNLIKTAEQENITKLFNHCVSLNIINQDVQKLQITIIYLYSYIFLLLPWNISPIIPHKLPSCICGLFIRGIFIEDIHANKELLLYYCILLYSDLYFRIYFSKS